MGGGGKKWKEEENGWKREMGGRGKLEKEEGMGGRGKIWMEEKNLGGGGGKWEEEEEEGDVAWFCQVKEWLLG